MGPLEELAAVKVARDTALTIGVFDGVHVGHRYLLDNVRTAAAERGLASAVVTFRNHPVTVLRPHVQVTYLCAVDQRMELLRQSGIEHVAPLTFTRELSRLTAREFVAALVERLRMRWLLVGPDFALGRGREGTFPVLTKLGKELGFEVARAAPFTEAGRVVSSTAIRRALAQGDVEQAAKFLGRAYSLTGPVVLGDRRGQTLGFPTANLQIAADISLPADGVYCTVTWVDQQPHDAVTNIGVRPTFGELKRTVEAHLLEFEGDLYDKTLTIELIERIRPEQRFSGVDELVAQLNRDVATAKGVLAARVSS
ncbi:MAG: bifunctional riboflavin kinase/FAD synthetase [Dehalococcoidia bacterium]